MGVFVLHDQYLCTLYTTVLDEVFVTVDTVFL